MTRSIRVAMTLAALAVGVAPASGDPQAAAQAPAQAPSQAPAPAPAPTNTPKFAVTLSTTSEKPAVANEENKGSGQATITFHLTRDAANVITAATADVVISLKGFPAETTITAAHIHRGAVATNGAVVFNPMFQAREMVLTGGAGTISKMGVTMPPELAQEILRGVSNFYLNVHSTLNPAGVARGQLTTAQ